MGKFQGTFRDAPWLGVDAIKKIEDIITPESRVLETGAGSSTLWLVSRVAYVVSFEHQEAWAKGVIEELNQRGIPRHKFEVYFNSSYPGEGVPNFDQMMDDFDLIIIDGRGRVQSVRTAYAYLKPGGWMVLDNSNRPRYEGAHLFLASLGWIGQNIESRIMPENKKGYTTFWRKPLNGDGD